MTEWQITVLGLVGLITLSASFCICMPLYGYFYYIFRKRIFPVYWNKKYFTDGQLCFYEGFPYKYFRSPIICAGITGISPYRKQLRKSDIRTKISRTELVLMRVALGTNYLGALSVFLLAFTYFLYKVYGYV